MTVGRPATPPPAGWVAPFVCGPELQVPFISEDGTQRAVFDFDRLPCDVRVRKELATCFTAVNGPLGTSRRVKTAQSYWGTVRFVSKWLAETRPGLRSLSELTAADIEMICMALRLPSGDKRCYEFRVLLRAGTVQLRPGVIDRFAQFDKKVRSDPAQPYSDVEFQRITTVLRAMVRNAKNRLREHRQLITDYRTGKFDELDRNEPRVVLAEVLDHCMRTGSLPLTGIRTPKRSARAWQAYLIGGSRPLHSLIHLTAAEAWAFAMLLAATTGHNRSVIETLPARHHLATAADEPQIALVEMNKPRRGRRARMTVPLTEMPPELRSPTAAPRPRRMAETSLTSAYGVFSLLLDLTEPGRTVLNTQSAFVYYNPTPPTRGAVVLSDGLPADGDHRRCHPRWLRPWLTGNEQDDALLLGIGFNRMRKTYLERTRAPTAHTPATLAGYLSRMDTVRYEGFQIVHEALEEQVQSALNRREMTLERNAMVAGEDTVLGVCTDFSHSPLDGGRACSQSFLNCLDCSNARALPRHLPMQLAVLDALRDLRAALTAHRWALEYAGRVAQIEDMLNAYEPAQLRDAREKISDDERRLALRLLDGVFDTL